MANATTSACPVLTENPIIVDLTTSYGSLLVGSWLSCAMWGVSSLQVFIYYMNSGDFDPQFLRILVYFGTYFIRVEQETGLLTCRLENRVFDTTNGLLVLKGQWRVLIHEYGKIGDLGDTQFEILHHTWIESIVIFVVQLYFIRRIYIFSKQSLRSEKLKYATLAILAVMVMLASWQLIGIAVYLSYGYGKSLEVLSTPRLIGLNISLRAAAVAADVLVSFGMVILLTRTGMPNFSKTKRMVHRLILVIVLSGALTAASATVVLILIKIYPASLYYCILEFSLCSLYFSTLLANLNTRDFVQSRGGINTLSTFNADYRSADNNALVLGPLTTHSGSGLSGTTASTIQGIQHAKDVKTEDPDAFSPLKDRSAV
ncbi:hypothetical protein ARMSODRAFT_1023540 [Armillaria solidipes]|uniref:DUF6534 domain-containing protein n=1 Tax=Armillaria solidipes TaxID=1076256 RepID=A0A2H3B4V8_9AGAR|nr:hypothetical protein ARMSODRAFT_1023540 [Armillaria solidipes]